jgi:4-hydroxythreonine-4-phosphate dehydrogenase
MGDPAGIGPDIALAAWLLRLEREVPAFYLVGDPEAIAARARLLGLTVDLVPFAPGEAITAWQSALPVMSTGATAPAVPGKADPANAAATIEAIALGVRDTMDGRAAALVTCPIAKKPLYESGFAFPGHTEFLADLASRARGTTFQPVMMLAGPDLRTVPVTIHIALSDVASALNATLVETTIRITARDLTSRFAVANPRIAVAGLNPHAGEGGAMGREEIEIIAPVVKKLRADGLDVSGPLSADTMFHEAARRTYDVAVCMYHDQALIPAKALAFDEAVNVTLGLPFIRTSPDHGTAYSLAGSGKASPSSLIAALRMARAMADRSARS